MVARAFIPLLKSGQRFGRLVAVEFVRRNQKGLQYWSFVCDCGKQVVTSASHAKYGQIKSCGCARSERLAARCREMHTTHGMANKTPEYKAWKEMRARCYYSRNPGWKNYGGRGITVCDRWKKFENFLADMGSKPSPKHSIDRRDNDGNYEPGNCRWATRGEQSRNYRRNVRVKFRGLDMVLTDACKLAGLNSKTVFNRIYSGWSAHKALTTPVLCW